MISLNKKPDWATSLSFKHEGGAGPVHFSDGAARSLPVANGAKNPAPGRNGNEYLAVWFTLEDAHRLAKVFRLPLEEF